MLFLTVFTRPIKTMYHASLGKVFPKLRRRATQKSQTSMTSMSSLNKSMSEDPGDDMCSSADEDETADYVFRIVNTANIVPENLRKLICPNPPSVIYFLKHGL